MTATTKSSLRRSRRGGTRSDRGQIWTLAGGVYGAKARPAVNVQDDLFDATSSVTVAPMTSTLLDASLMRIGISGGGGPFGTRSRQ